MTTQKLLHLWHAALASPPGVRVHTNSRDALRQKLYAARASAADPDLEGLSLVLAPNNPDEIWILHNGKRD